MLNAGLYTIVVLVWGATWLAIKFQMGVVPPVQSVFYRFLIAAVLLQGWRLFSGARRRFDLKTHMLFIALAVSLFSANYILFYLATDLGLTTGLEAVIFSLLIVMNIVHCRIFFGEKPQAQLAAGTVIGLAGLCLLFEKDLPQVFSGTDLGLAVLLSALATYIVSLGNMLSRVLQARRVDVLSANAWGMSYGCVILFCVCVCTSGPFVFSWTQKYLVSLGILAVFGSVIAFWAYLKLLGRIGAARAAYATIAFPIVALILSSLFEGYHWTGLRLIGCVLIISGNLVLLGRVHKIRRLSLR